MDIKSRVNLIEYVSHILNIPKDNCIVISQLGYKKNIIFYKNDRIHNYKLVGKYVSLNKAYQITTERVDRLFPTELLYTKTSSTIVEENNEGFL